MQPTPHLSKVIPRKDLPRIYTMYLPPSALKGAAAKSAPSSAPPEAGAAASSLAHALAELSGARDEVLHAVRSAPERRVDNLITRAHDAAAMLRVHALVLEEVRRSYTQLRVGYAALTAWVHSKPWLNWLEEGGLGLLKPSPAPAYRSLT